VAEGAWYSTDDEDAGAPVAVIGQTVADNLFTPLGVDPVGQTILIHGDPFRVVGVLAAKGAQGALNQDDVVYVPFAAAQTRLRNTGFISQIQVQVDNAANVDATQQVVTTTLEQRHHIEPGGADDFQIRSANQLVQTAQQFSTTLTLLLVSIAAISLIVGGIGIMNIMLVSVTERTREIGVRMSVGARRSDVRNQFLIEALTLSATGGVLGILFGLGLGLPITAAFGLPLTANPIPILLAFGVSAAIGVSFGFYPAVRASQLDPIIALRTD
jgi:ABC-type antimicrobial peptide transport system permease subunit